MKKEQQQKRRRRIRRNQKSKIQKQKNHKQKNAGQETKQVICSACLIQIQTKTQQLFDSQCNHRYHLNCFLQWLKLNKTTCCMCRQELRQGQIYQNQKLMNEIAFIPGGQLTYVANSHHYQFYNDIQRKLLLPSSEIFYYQQTPQYCYREIYVNIKNQNFFILQKIRNLFKIVPYQPYNQIRNAIQNQDQTQNQMINNNHDDSQFQGEEQIEEIQYQEEREQVQESQQIEDILAQEQIDDAGLIYLQAAQEIHQKFEEMQSVYQQLNQSFQRMRQIRRTIASSDRRSQNRLRDLGVRRLGSDSRRQRN